jgi:hypothetical protein
LPLKGLIQKFAEGAYIAMLRAFEHIGSLQIRGGDKWRTTFGTSQSESRFLGHVVRLEPEFWDYLREMPMSGE